MFICYIYEIKIVPRKSDRLKFPNWHFPKLPFPPTAGTPNGCQGSGFMGTMGSWVPIQQPRGLSNNYFYQTYIDYEDLYTRMNTEWPAIMVKMTLMFYS